MEIVSLVVAFVLILFLISRRISMGLSLLGGGLLFGVLSPLSLAELGIAVIDGLRAPMTLQLMLIVGLISGLGFIMKRTGDLELLIGALISLIKNTKILIMFVPALIGTLNVPGGAILSAPMVEESGDYLKLSSVEKHTVNLFFRHVGFFIYPLYPSMIIVSELLEVDILLLIRHTAVVMLAGLVAAYLVLFRGVVDNRSEEDGEGVFSELVHFFSGFSSILVILVLALGFRVPFFIAVMIGVIVALFRRLAFDQFLSAGRERVVAFFAEGVNYSLVLTIAGVMVFKEIIETSGVVDTVAEGLIAAGIPLPFMVVMVSFLAGYVTGVHMAAAGMLIPLFAPLFPADNMGVFAALLFTSINLGYLISPLHLCLALSNDYFEVTILPVYRRLLLPVLVMLFTALIMAL